MVLTLFVQNTLKAKASARVASARPGVSSVRVKKVKGKKGVVKEQHDLIVNIDLVCYICTL